MLGMPPRGYLRLRNSRARATDLGQGPHLHRDVRAGSLRAPCREHEKRPAAGREKHADVQKNAFVEDRVVTISS